MTRSHLGVLGMAVILSATLLAAAVLDHGVSATLARHLDQFPSSLGDWTSSTPPQTLDPNVEKTLGATEYTERTFARKGSSVDLFIAYYANQRAGESMHSPLNCLPGAGWEFWSRDTAAVTAGGKTVRINRDGIQNGGTRAVVLYWYQTPKRIFADEYLGKVFLVWDSITTSRSEGSIARLVVPDRPGAVEDGLSLASLVIPQVQSSFVP
jgi:EpsI family protein